MSDLEEGESKVETSELLWRNAHPDFVDGDRLSSQAFRLSTDDEGKLSVARETLVTAEDHYKEYVGDFGLLSAGVWAVSTDEVWTEFVEVVDDGDVDDGHDRPLGHAYLDLRNHTTRQARSLGGRLRTFAQERGRQHPDSEEEPFDTPGGSLGVAPA